ncbi:MAG: hypothetical protein AB7O52_11325 [Planctomycetota bacterium]
MVLPRRFASWFGVLVWVALVAGFAPGVAEAQVFRRGDVNDDGVVGPEDVVCLLSFLLMGGSPPSGCTNSWDADDDEAANVGDTVALLNYLGFGIPTPAPGPVACGPDPTTGVLSCVAYTHCSALPPTPSGNFTLRVGSTTVGAFGTATVPIILDVAAADGLYAVAFRICVNPTDATITNLTLSPPAPCAALSLASSFTSTTALALLASGSACSLPAGSYPVASLDVTALTTASFSIDLCTVDGFDARVVSLAAGGPCQAVQPTTVNGVVASAQEFVRADCNVSGVFDIADVIYLLCLLFPNPACPIVVLQCEDACDKNDDGTINIGDAIAMLSCLFPPPGPPPVPPPPFPACGPDPTFDVLTCNSFVPVCP